MPKVIGAEYLVDYLFGRGKAGISIAGAMGAGPLTHGELVAWQFNARMRLEWWEAEFMVALSGAYLAQKQKSTQRGCPAPFGAVSREDVAVKIDSVFG